MGYCCSRDLVPGIELVLLQRSLACEAQPAELKCDLDTDPQKRRTRRLPLDLSDRALVWVVIKVSNALVSDGVLEVVLHLVRT